LDEVKRSLKAGLNPALEKKSLKEAEILITSHQLGQ
jgi:hypothetical protein